MQVLIPALAAAGLAASAGQRLAVARLAGLAVTALQWVTAGLLTAALFVALGLRLPAGLVLAAGCWLVACAVPLSWIDVRLQRLPDVLTYAAAAGVLGLLTAAAWANGDWHRLLRAALAGLLLAAGFLALAVASPAGVGLGDVKLAASVGAMLGWAGWLVLAGGVFAAFALAACYGLVLLAARRATLGSRIPFGPFLLAGAIALLLIAAPG
jgi:leader peptidase (prepilin peptidase) / N-methyltransferase